MAVVTVSSSNSVATTTGVSAATITIPAQTGSQIALYGAVCSWSDSPSAANFVISAATSVLFKAYFQAVSGANATEVAPDTERLDFVNWLAPTSQAITLRMSSGGCSAVLNAWWGYV